MIYYRTLYRKYQFDLPSEFLTKLDFRQRAKKPLSRGGSERKNLKSRKKVYATQLIEGKIISKKKREIQNPGLMNLKEICKKAL